MDKSIIFNTTIDKIVNDDPTILISTKCRLISELGPTISDLHLTQLYHFYISQNQHLIENELLFYFLRHPNLNIMVLLKQVTDLRIESDKSIILLLHLTLKEPDLFLFQSKIFSLNQIFIATSRHLSNTTIVTLANDFVYLLLNTYSVTVENTIGNDAFDLFVESCYLNILDSLDGVVFEVLNNFLIICSANQIEWMVNHFNISHLIQSTILSTIYVQCIKFIEVINYTFKEEFLKDFFTQPPLADFIVECFFEHPNEKVIIKTLQYLNLSQSISSQIVKLLEPSLFAVPLINHISPQIPHDTIIGVVQQIVYNIRDQMITNDFVQLLLHVNCRDSIDISQIIPNIMFFIENSNELQHNYELIKVLSQPKYQLQFLIHNGIELMLNLGCSKQLYNILKCSLFDVIHELFNIEYRIDEQLIPNSKEQLQDSIDSTTSIALIWLSLLSKPLLSSQFISTIQPQDSIGSLLLISIQVHLGIQATVSIQNISSLFGDVPYSGLLSFPLLKHILSPEYTELLQQNRLLIYNSIQCVFQDPNFEFLGFEEKNGFQNMVEWFRMAIGR